MYVSLCLRRFVCSHVGIFFHTLRTRATRLLFPGTNQVGLGQMLLPPHHLSHRTTPELESETPWPTCRHRDRGHQGIMACPRFDFMRLRGVYWSHRRPALCRSENSLRNSPGGLSPFTRTCRDMYCTTFLIATYLSLFWAVPHIPFVLKHIYDFFGIIVTKAKWVLRE